MDTWASKYSQTDDLEALREDLTGFQAAYERVNEYAQEIGLEINTNETKMFVTTDSHPNRPKQLDG